MDDDDIDVKEEVDGASIPPSTYKITTYPLDHTLETLYSNLGNGNISPPEFQRKNVWTPSKKSKLIDSLMMGLPIPPVYLYKKYDEKYWIIDGRQRLETVKEFKDDLIKIEITKTNEETVFKKFSDFTPIEKRRFMNKILRSIIIQQDDPKGYSSIYQIFERLNTGGESLKDQEVRNCVYNGKLNNTLIYLNSYSSWRNFLGKVRENKRQKDVELILRYMALFHNVDNYKKPMKDFLSQFMEKECNPSEQFLDIEKKRFMKMTDAVYDACGSRFGRKGSLNPSMMDAVFIAFAKNISRIPPDIKERIQKLFNNEDFKIAITDATTDTKSIEARIKLADNILFG